MRYDRLKELLWQYCFTAACIVGPLVMLSVVTCFISYLVPCTVDPRPDRTLPPGCRAIMPSSPVNLDYYFPAQPPAPDATKQPGITQAKEAAGDATKRAVPRRMFLWGKDFYGRSSYAIASSFLFLASAVAFVFSLCVIVKRVGWAPAALAVAGFAVVAGYIVYYLGNPSGRIYVVDLPLYQSDNATTDFRILSGFARAPGSDSLLARLVDVNTFISLVPVGMVLAALGVLSIRNFHSAPDPDDLKVRRTMIHWALGLGSAILVIGVLAQKIMVEWPLSLLNDAQAGDLRPIAQALTLGLGANGTIAMITGFGPAIAAWYLDVYRFRAGRQAGVTAAPAPKVADDKDKPAPAATGDDLVFAPATTMLAIGGAIAPLLASPLIDALTALLKL